MTNTTTKPKKRGRKPNSLYYIDKQIEEVDTSNVSIIINLPIFLNNIEQSSSNEIEIDNEVIPYNEDNFSLIKTQEQVIIKNKQTSDRSVDKAQGNVKYYSQKLLQKDLSATDIKDIKTDIDCFWCCHSFTTDVVFMPIKINVNDTFRVKGIFCSYECCNSYMRNDPKHLRYVHMLRFMKSKVCGIPLFRTKLGKAPPREALKKFGGHLNIEEFRGNNKQYSILKYPFYYVEDILRETTKVEYKSTAISLHTETKINKGKMSKSSLHNFIKIKNN